MEFTNFPSEVSSRIIQKLDIKNLLNVFRVNKTLNKKSSSDFFWQIYFTENVEPQEYGLNSWTTEEISTFLFRNTLTDDQTHIGTNNHLVNNKSNTSIWKLFSEVVIKGREVPKITDNKIKYNYKLYANDTPASIIKRNKKDSFIIFIYDRSASRLYVYFHWDNKLQDMYATTVTTYHMCDDPSKFGNFVERKINPTTVSWIFDNKNLFNSEMVVRGSTCGNYSDFAYKYFYDI
jgi:hypothetical protein